MGVHGKLGFSQQNFRTDTFSRVHPFPNAGACSLSWYAQFYITAKDVKWRRVQQAWNVNNMGKQETDTEFWWGSPVESCHLVEKDMGGYITIDLREIINWTELSHNHIQWLSVILEKLNIWFLLFLWFWWNVSLLLTLARRIPMTHLSSEAWSSAHRNFIYLLDLGCCSLGCLIAKQKSVGDLNFLRHPTP